MAKTNKKNITTEKPPDVDTIIAALVLMRGKHEVRRYTFDLHGNDFIGLAEEYARKNKKLGYSVSLLAKL